MASSRFTLAGLHPRNQEWHGWRSFFLAVLALGVALGLALISSLAADAGSEWLAGTAAVLALVLAAAVGLAVIPVLARRSSLRWLAYQVDYRLTREGLAYIAVLLVLALAAVNTGNNLLFMVLACLLAGMLVSGIVSRVVLSGVGLKFEMPEHVFARQPLLATMTLENEKEWLPSFSLSVVAHSGKAKHRAAQQDAPPGARILTRPVYFPYLQSRSAVSQKVELLFPRRGVYRQDAFGIRTKFPFGFLEKTRRVDSPIEAVVYPSVEPTETFYEVLPLLSGEMASFQRGRGYELHSIRDYAPADSVRYVDWKSTARTGTLKIREFTREDERRLILVLDPAAPSGRLAPEQFERGVAMAAAIAWHFHETGAVMQLRTDRECTPMVGSDEMIYDALRELAVVEMHAGISRDPAGRTLLEELAERGDVFKIILTAQPRGSIPTALWTSSYFIFMDSL
jgi:uncharacterized protein (DUF58 family)